MEKLKMFIRFVYFIVFVIFPYLASAQSIPKRDASKDRSVIIAKQKEESKKKASRITAEKEQRDAARRRKQNLANKNQKTASYLYINQETELDKEIDAQSKLEIYTINTNASEWGVFNLPIWCKLYEKTANTFTLLYETNNTYRERRDWFEVKAGDKIVSVKLTQSPKPITVSAKINYVSISHNVRKAEGESLVIKANTTLYDGYGLDCVCLMTITDEEGNSIQSTENDYSLNTFNKKLYVTNRIVPTSNRWTHDIEFYLPNKTILLNKKKNHLKCILSIYCNNTYQNVSPFKVIDIKAKKKKGRIITESVQKNVVLY